MMSSRHFNVVHEVVRCRTKNCSYCLRARVSADDQLAGFLPTEGEFCEEGKGREVALSSFFFVFLLLVFSFSFEYSLIVLHTCQGYVHFRVSAPDWLFCCYCCFFVAAFLCSGLIVLFNPALAMFSTQHMHPGAKMS